MCFVRSAGVGSGMSSAGNRRRHPERFRPSRALRLQTLTSRRRSQDRGASKKSPEFRSRQRFSCAPVEDHEPVSPTGRADAVPRRPRLHLRPLAPAATAASPRSAAAIVAVDRGRRADAGLCRQARRRGRARRGRPRGGARRRASHAFAVILALGAGDGACSAISPSSASSG